MLVRERSRLAGFLVLALLAVGDRGAANPQLQASIDLARARALLGQKSHFGACPEAPVPVTDMSGFVSRYDPKDPTQSKVDQEREQREKSRSDRFTNFATSLDHLSDSAIRANPPDPAIAACVMRQLAAWARAGAMTARLDDNDRIGRHQAVMMQAWLGSAFSSVVTRVGGFSSAPGTDAEAVRVWFRALAKSIMAEYSAPADWLLPTNNHVYWAAYCVATIGVLLNDQEMVDFGRGWLLTALSEVSADGAMPKEMARGDRAFMYQQFATLPIAALVAINDRNGAPLNQDQEKAFERLLAFNASFAFHLDKVEQLSHAVQIPANASYDFAWIDISLPHVSKRNERLAKSLEAIAAAPGMRPAWHIWLGGDVTAAYNPASLTGAR